MQKKEDFYLRDVGESNDVGHNANNCNEYLSAFSEDVREFINQSSDESFHSAELEMVQSHVRHSKSDLKV